MNKYLVCDSSGLCHTVNANEFGIENSCYAVFTVYFEVVAIFNSPVFVKKKRIIAAMKPRIRAYSRYYYDWLNVVNKFYPRKSLN